MSRTPVAEEINRLHLEAKHNAEASRETLHASLVAAWHAGNLLISEKKRIMRAVGAGSWLHWLEANFDGTVRTAQRYMKLAKAISDAALLQGMSLQ